MHYVYILKLTNGDEYVGYSKDLKTRLVRHKQKSTPTTKRIAPERLIFYAAFESKRKALDFEKYLKTASGHAFRNKRLI